MRTSARLRAAADEMRIAQAREQLVQVVPGHPFAVDRERLDVKRARGDLLPQLAAARNAADVAVAVGALARGELLDHVVEPPLHLGIAGRRPDLRQRREVMAGRVPVEPGALPVRILGSLR